jgi:hypothetical protein
MRLVLMFRYWCTVVVVVIALVRVKDKVGGQVESREEGFFSSQSSHLWVAFFRFRFSHYESFFFAI